MDATGGNARAFVVDDDETTIKLLTALLQQDGFDVESTRDSTVALKLIAEKRPDIVLCDLMMPQVDGFELCKQLRSHPEIGQTPFVVVTAKAYQSDENQAINHGADGFFRKPVNPDTFAKELRRILADHIDMTFWGVRGTLPRTGAGAIRYGGNTSCVSLEFPRQQLFVFDGGSGIRELGNRLLKNGRKRVNAKLFISHPHWDHINAIPFCAPLYIQGNEFEILGAKQGDLTMRELISAQMDGIYFPITLTEFAARVYFRDLGEGDHEIAGIPVKAKLTSHPGRCLAYRVDYNGRSICYVTDQELYLEDDPHYDPHYEKTMADFVRGCDALITDTTYTDEEYKTKVGWGHSCVSKVCGLAAAGEVKKLYLFHHDPDQDDDAIDAKYESAINVLKKMGSDVECLAPKEGDTVRL